MRVAIVKSDGYLDSRISRILANNSIDGDIITKVVRSTFNEYDAIIFTYQNKKNMEAIRQTVKVKNEKINSKKN